MNLDPLMIGAPDECWEWTGAPNNQGYGTRTVQGRTVMVHRFTSELVNGPIPDGLVIDHLCRNKACANPRHLEAVTQSENAKRGDLHNRRKTHCPQGHEYDAVHVWNSARQGRVVARRCSECRRQQARRKAERQRAA